MQRRQTILPILVLLTVGIVGMIPTGLSAQFSCVGNGCQHLPFSQDKVNKQILHEFERQYTDKVFDDIAEASALANIAGPPIGTVNLAGFTFGTNVGLSIVEPRTVDVDIPDVGRFEDVPVAGAAFMPRVYLGLNLGQILGLGYDPFSGDRPSMISPSRFDIYISAMDVAERLKNVNETQGDISASLYSRGIEVRYHLVEGVELFGPFLRFLGVSVGAGMYTSRQHIKFHQNNMKLDTTVSGETLIWEGNNVIEWETKLDSYPVDVRTGIQLLYFLNLTIGAGVSMNKGTTHFTMSRSGPVYSRGGYSELAAQFGYAPIDAQLAMTINGKGEVPSRMVFGRLGVEFNLIWIKISVDGTASERARSANIGIRLEI